MTSFLTEKEKKTSLIFFFFFSSHVDLVLISAKNEEILKDGTNNSRSSSCSFLFFFFLEHRRRVFFVAYCNIAKLYLAVSREIPFTVPFNVSARLSRPSSGIRFAVSPQANFCERNDSVNAYLNTRYVTQRSPRCDTGLLTLSLLFPPIHTSGFFYFSVQSAWCFGCKRMVQALGCRLNCRYLVSIAKCCMCADNHQHSFSIT